ncbi:unnamed protein product [Medioppia subpectinata]|uniref:FHF complex subunit HOOK-interacting protein C-terminal domain-containing protein n=1 Tax=Medioppia subpectinata TaxID=1979941 RepID=A0A7R9PZL2_9ACAR|nr:unnamed protein product [Medioppia subpectinata]CAG2107074.1 unnamed protein product [Medioppia subpectinata]
MTESVREQIDTSAALDSFRTHWSQAFDIMSRKVMNDITVDDISSVVNHIDQMLTLLLQENDSMCFASRPKPLSATDSGAMSPLLEYLLMESVLEKVLSWSEMCGEWYEVMTLEQLKLYEMLISQICHNTALFQQQLIRPLLGLLCRFVDKTCQLEVEKRLVVLLNSLFVSLSQNLNLLELFFLSEPLIASHMETKFLIFSLLIPYVHRDGPVGQQARDAILLCMAFTRRNELMGKFVAEETDFCPVLATGLSGLYSSLPRRLLTHSIVSDDWHQITNEDIQENHELEVFLNSLEFCNAVAQIAHPFIQKQLLQYIYNGFLVPVIGPALHQSVNKDNVMLFSVSVCVAIHVCNEQEVVGVPIILLERLSRYSNTLEEIIATTAYFDLFIRTISEPNLLKVFLKFICIEKYEEQRILSTLITRISANSKIFSVSVCVAIHVCNEQEVVGVPIILLERLSRYSNTLEEIIATTAYFDLFIRTISEPNLLKVFLKFICIEKYEEQRILSTLITRISANSKLSLVTLVLFRSLMDLNCEDVLLELVLKYLTSGKHIIGGKQHQMQRINDSNYLNESARHLFTLIPKHCLSSHLNYMNKNAKSDGYVFLENNDSSSQNSADSVDHNNISTQELHYILFNYLDYLRDANIVISKSIRATPICENDVYTNLQLTGLLARLAAYPQPLLRSYLLNPSLVFQKDVKSLITLLNELRKKLDQLSEDIENFDELLRNARHFLFARENRMLNRKQSFLPQIDNNFHYNSRPSRSNSITSLASIRSESGTEVLKKGFNSLKERLFRSTPKNMRRSTSMSVQPLPPPPVLESVSGGQGYRYFKPFDSPEQALDANEVEERERIQKIVLATIVFEEFVRELSAISYEHFILEYSDPTSAQNQSELKS